jgi:hypothetical protein
MFDWLPFAPLGAAMLHMTEEFVYPGGFPDWFRRYRVDPSRVTRRTLIIINAMLLIVCADIASLGRTRPGVIYWMIIAALLCGNGIWHAWAALRSRGYSPGMITGLLIYVPLAIYGYTQFLGSGAVSIRVALIAAAVGGSFQFWDALYHRSLGAIFRGRSR